MKKVLIILSVLFLTLFLLTGCANNKSTKENEQQLKSEQESWMFIANPKNNNVALPVYIEGRMSSNQVKT